MWVVIVPEVRSIGLTVHNYSDIVLIEVRKRLKAPVSRYEPSPQSQRSNLDKSAAVILLKSCLARGEYVYGYSQSSMHPLLDLMVVVPSWWLFESVTKRCPSRMVIGFPRTPVTDHGRLY